MPFIIKSVCKCKQIKVYAEMVFVFCSNLFAVRLSPNSVSVSDPQFALIKIELLFFLLRLARKRGAAV